MLELLRRVAGTAYDRAGGLVALNLVWDLAILPWALVGTALALAGEAVRAGPGVRLTAWLVAAEWILLSPPTALLCAAADEWLQGRSVQLWPLLKARARGLVRAQALGAAAAAIAGVLGANAVFYHRVGGWLGAALAALMLWMLLALQLVALYILPAAVAPRTAGLGAALRQAAALAVQRPGFSAFLLSLLAAVILVGLATGVGLILGLASAASLLLAAGFRHLASTSWDDAAHSASA